jgi:N-acetylmuramoyl-L-alanine amidase
MKPIIILDNGHGKETHGKRSPLWNDGSQLLEYEFNRDIVKRIVAMLQKNNIAYHVLVPEDTDIPLQERCKRANTITQQWNGNAILISIHANAGGGSGWECYTSEGITKADYYASILCGQCKHDFPEWKMRFDTSDGDDDKESPFYILTHTVCPAMLSENFFMDTEKDCRFILSEAGRNRIAKAHVEAIIKMVNTD